MAGGSTSSGLALDVSFRNIAGLAANFHAADQACTRAVQDAVRRAGAQCLARARELCPVDTGRMQRLLKTVYSPQGFVFETGWEEADFTAENQPGYFIYQEFGTRFHRAQPCLAPAYAEVKPVFQADVSAALSDAIERTRYVQ